MSHDPERPYYRAPQSLEGLAIEVHDRMMDVGRRLDGNQDQVADFREEALKRLDAINGQVKEHALWINQRKIELATEAGYRRGQAETRGTAIAFSRTALGFVVGLATFVSIAISVGMSLLRGGW